MSALDDVTFSPEKEVTLEDFESVLPSVKPTALREIFTEKPKTKWSDIGGSDNIKKSFDRIIAGPLKYGEQMAKIDKRLTKGVLLYGPPGCSKTLTAQAVASTYDFNFIAIKGAELLSSYVGESERAVREVFRKAKAAAPCVIFFDEIDSIGSNRDSGHTPGLNVLTTLLNEMDGFESLRNVLVLAATNKPEALDPALMRPGRFDRKVHLDLPNDVARKEILKIATRRVTMCSDVDFDALVVATSGYSGAEVVHICETAKEKALIRWIEKANQEMMLMREDFEAAIVETPRGITMEMIETYRAFEKRK
jgi:AAA family ATPase